jgi:HEAT repeat protein
VGSDALAPVVVFEALGRLDGVLTPAQTTRLLAQPESAAHRAVGARYASGPEIDKRLDRLIRRDAAPEVRAAALRRLVELRGVGAIDRVVYGLGDEDVRVREAAILSIGALGPDALPALRDVVENGPTEAARSAVGALSMMQDDAARRALVEISETHPDAGVRTLARTALGRPIGHRHE